MSGSVWLPVGDGGAPVPAGPGPRGGWSGYYGIVGTGSGLSRVAVTSVGFPEKIAKLQGGDKSVGSVADFDIRGLEFADRLSC